MSDLEERRLHGWIVRIDRTICVGFGDCLDAAPGGLELDDEGIAVFTPAVADLPADALIDACRCCPVDAITVHDDAGRQIAP
jgi:ferredoxin